MTITGKPDTTVCSGSCIIDPWDLIRFPYSMMSMNPVLAIAAKHGCPADGVLYPEPVAGVRYTRINRADGTIELRWDSCQIALDLDAETCNLLSTETR